MDENQIMGWVKQYAPELHFHPDEQYFPGTVDLYLQKVALFKKDVGQVAPAAPGIGVKSEDLVANNVDQNCYLQIGDESVKGGNLAQAQVYVHVRQAVSAASFQFYDLQYWFFYAFRGASIGRFDNPLYKSSTFPLDPCGEHQGEMNSSMRNTRFIFVEGIMGAGKSTTAWFLTEQIEAHWLTARFMAEGPTIDEPYHPLRIANTLPHPKAVWLDVTVEEFIELSLQRWRDFVRETQQSATITVCDGLLFHGNMTDVLLMNAEPAVLQSYVMQVIESIAALNPVVIYFYHADVARALRTICDARGSEWEAYQVNWKTSTPYAIQQSLHGFDGLVQLYQNYRDLCNDIFAQLTQPKLAILNEGDWDRYYDDILSFLQLPSIHR